MAKYSSPFILFLLFALGSCQTMEELSIDYMLPADISFPSELTRVAIVNNTSATSDHQLTATKEALKVNEISRAVVYHDGDVSTTLQSLAENMAKENYFNEVVICDSALRAKDILPRENTLSQEEVQNLTENLDVDFLISLENLQLKASRTVRYIPEWTCYQATIDMKVYPTIKIYLPTRKGPMVTINPTDSIFWEELGSTENYVRTHLLGDDKMLKEASEFAGIIPVKQLLPYWQTQKRYIYTSGSVDMRDAAIYAREKSWDKAFTLWQRAYQSTKNEKKQMYAALNIALYYEMQDSIIQAETWAVKAQTLAHKIEKIDTKTETEIDINSIQKYLMATRYVAELKLRKEGLSKLNMQMSRFNDDF